MNLFMEYLSWQEEIINNEWNVSKLKKITISNQIRGRKGEKKKKAKEKEKEKETRKKKR